MATQRIERHVPSRPLGSIGLALAAGLVCGALVSLTAFLLARYGPATGGWSFRGNGALAAYSLIPALLAGGWTAVVLHHRGRRSVGSGSLAAAVGIALAVVDAALLPMFGPGWDRALGPVLLVALAAWSLVAPVGAMLLYRPVAPADTSVASSIGSALLWAVGLGAGLLLLGLVFPAGS